jgi:hypothetical protein
LTKPCLVYGIIVSKGGYDGHMTSCPRLCFHSFLLSISVRCIVVNSGECPLRAKKKPWGLPMALRKLYVDDHKTNVLKAMGSPNRFIPCFLPTIFLISGRTFINFPFVTLLGR